MTDKKAKLFLLPILIIIVIYSIFKTIKTEKNENQLKAENNYVIGEITDHKVYGLAESYYIHYKYSVNGTEYSKSMNNSFKYTDCEKTRNCIGMKHVVYYDIKNPKNAFMDLNLTELEMYRKNVKKNNVKERMNKL